MDSTDPQVGLAAVAALRTLVERLEALHVANARERGWSWQEIGGALGVSQAGRPPQARATQEVAGLMFERFTDDARAAVVAAQAESAALHHGWIGTEHLLLGILAGAGDGARLLAGFGVDARASVRTSSRSSAAARRASTPTPWPPRASTSTPCASASSAPSGPAR